MINSIVLEGKVKRVEKKQVGEKTLTKFDICNVTGWGDNVKYNWFRVTMWRDIPLEENTKVAISGRIEQDEYQDQDGNSKKVFNVTANELSFLDKKE